MSEKKSSATEWQRLAKSVAAKINVAWWLEKLAVPLMVSALVGACLILLARREVSEFPWLGAAITGTVVTLSLGLLAWWLARRHFESADDAKSGLSDAHLRAVRFYRALIPHARHQAL